jgi:hypothetical protein
MITFGNILEKMLSNTCPYGDVIIDGVLWDRFVYDLHCSEMVVMARFINGKCVIRSVSFGCESMSSGCTSCDTTTYDEVVQEGSK